MTNTVRNLDSLCAVHGRGIISDAEITQTQKREADGYLTKALGVLQEDGLYAFYLYLAYREKKTKALPETQKHSLRLLCNELRLTHEKIGEEDLNDPQKRKDKSFIVAEKLVQDLDKLLFAKDLLEQMLVYARYHAKSL